MVCWYCQKSWFMCLVALWQVSPTWRLDLLGLLVLSGKVVHVSSWPMASQPNMASRPSWFAGTVRKGGSCVLLTYGKSAQHGVSTYLVCWYCQESWFMCLVDLWQVSPTWRLDLLGLLGYCFIFSWQLSWQSNQYILTS